MIAIVGAGVGGLALGRALRQRGADFVILEASHEPGGVVRSTRVDDLVIDLGPQRLRWTPRLAGLATALGIEGEIITAPDLPLLVLHDGRLRPAPLSARAALRSDLLPWTAKLRAALEPLAGPPRPDETAAGYLSRRFGRTTYERLLAPLFGGLYASDPADMFARHALDRLLRDFGIRRFALGKLLRASLAASGSRAPACSFQDGLATLPRAMYADVAEHTRLRTSVLRIERDGAAFTLDTSDGTVRADRVVLTCDAAAAAAMLEDIAGDAAQRLRALRYNRLAIVHLRSDARIRAAGYQVAFTEMVRTRGVTFHHALFGRRGLYTAFLGGARDPHVVDLADDEIGRIAASEFERATGAAAAPLRVSRAAIPAWDRSWVAIEGLQTPDGIHICANYESRVGIPARLAAAEALAARLAS